MIVRDGPVCNGVCKLHLLCRFDVSSSTYSSFVLHISALLGKWSSLCEQLLMYRYQTLSIYPNGSLANVTSS